MSLYLLAADVEMTAFIAIVAWLAVLMLCLLIDHALGEPPTRWHPVVWQGHLLNAMARYVPAQPAVAAFLLGAMAWIAGAGLSVLLWGLLPQTALATLARQSLSAQLLSLLLMALWLKPMLSFRLLKTEVQAVEKMLTHDLTQARQQLARICSRDVSTLNATQIRETAVESLAENFNDSVIAPLFWFALAGLPGAALYRWANTADAMWGYRSVRWQWAGKWTARADDVLSWIPARLSAALLLPGSYRPPHRLRLRQQARLTPSPNSGWPMAALALKLNLRLSKPSVYVLNPKGCAPQAGDIARAVALLNRALRHALLLALVVVAVAGLLTPLQRSLLRFA